MALLSCQMLQTQVLHEDTGSATEATGKPVMVTRSLGAAAEDSSGLIEADDYKSQNCKDYTRKSMQLLAVMSSL